MVGVQGRTQEEILLALLEAGAKPNHISNRVRLSHHLARTKKLAMMTLIFWPFFGLFFPLLCSGDFADGDRSDADFANRVPQAPGIRRPTPGSCEFVV